MPLSDALVVVLVSAVTVATDLAIAVVVGVIVSALVFAWKTARHIYVDAGVGTTLHRRVYNLHGQLCFASVSTFRDLFDPANDPDEVVINFANSRVWDHSGMEAIVELAQRYGRARKRLHLLNLSPNCQEMLQKANVLGPRDTEGNPSYRVAVSDLGDSD